MAAKKKPSPVHPDYFKAKGLAAQEAAKRAKNLVTFVTEETVAALRVLIVRGIRDGIPPYDLARLIVGLLKKPGATTNEAPGLFGLNVPQAQAALSYREALVDLATDGGKVPLTVKRAALLDKQMTRYVTRKLRERARTIARTEAARAVNDGARAHYVQAVADGWLPPTSRLVWITTPDEKRCSVCGPMHGKTTPVGHDFAGADGPPAHPRCRCTIALASRLVTPKQEAEYRKALASGEVAAVFDEALA